jgi:hypothetical protein
LIETQETQPTLTIWHKLYMLDRRWLYLILILLVVVQTLSPLDIPNVVSPRSQALYDHLSQQPPGSFVVVQTDWTYSTRGESYAQFKALIRLLMRKKIRFVVTTAGSDPQAPVIAKQIISQLAKEPGGNNYEEGKDYAIAGFFPSAEAHIRAMVNNIRGELGTRGLGDSPVLEGVRDLSDAKAVINITGSATITLWIERIRNKAPLGLMCTAVMSAENIPYYIAGQLKGIVIGAKGAFDFETLLAKEFPNSQPEFKDYKNYDAGRRYMGPLAFALLLLIVSVIVGNIAMIQVRRSGGIRS